MAQVIPLEEISEKFAEMIHKIIEEYRKDLEIEIEPVLKKVAETFKNDLYQVTPVSETDGGEYGHLRDNLRSYKSTRKGEPRYIVDFGKKGYVATFLEYGWVTQNGKRVPPKAFVIPTFERNKERYYQKIKQHIETVAKVDAK